MRFALLVPVALLASGCATAPAVGAGTKVRRETRPECERYCGELGMRLGAIVLIQSAAGCVCEPRPPAPPEGAPAPQSTTEPRTSRPGAAALAAGAFLLAQLREQQDAASRQAIPPGPVGPPYSAGAASSPGARW